MVVKDLRVELRPKTKKSDIYARRQVLSKILEGIWATSFKGRGIEFAGYRKYTYDDDASLIDWKASLRSKDILVREFEEYKTFSIFFLFDVSDSMLFSSTDKLKAEYAAEMIFSLADALLRVGDAVGMAMFNDDLVSVILPDIGSGVIDRFEKELSNPKNYGGGFDFKKAVKESISLLSSNAIIIIVSDFIGLPESWQKYISMIGGYFEVIALMVRDVRDRELPHGRAFFTIKDPYSDDSIFINVDDFRKQYHELVLEQEKTVKNTFESVKGGFALITTDNDFVDPIIRLFKKRRFVTANL